MCKIFELKHLIFLLKMTTLTFHLTPEQLSDPEILRKLQEFSDALKPKVPTPEEIQEFRTKEFEKNKFIFKIVANHLNTMIENKTGKKVGITDKALFELYLISQNKHDITKIMTVWSLPLFALFSENFSCFSSSESVSRARSGPSLSRRNECPSPAPAPREEVRTEPPTSAPTSSPYAEFSGLAPLIQGAFGLLTSHAQGTQNIFDMINQLNTTLQTPPPSTPLPTNPTPEEMLSALFGNAAGATPKPL